MLRSLSAKAFAPALKFWGVESPYNREVVSYFDKFSLSQRCHRAPIDPLGPEAGYQLFSTGISTCALP
jgi:hypothetical protein